MCVCVCECTYTNWLFLSGSIISDSSFQFCIIFVIYFYSKYVVLLTSEIMHRYFLDSLTEKSLWLFLKKTLSRFWICRSESHR